MSNAGNEQPIENAGDVIEKFGGIRPMSTKTGVAVTTIQGWKKRNVIPANRLDEIKAAAAKHGIDLASVLGEATDVPKIGTKDLELENLVSAEVDQVARYEIAATEADAGNLEEEIDVDQIEVSIQEDKIVPVEQAEKIRVDVLSIKPAASFLSEKAQDESGVKAIREKNFTEIIVDEKKRGFAKGVLFTAGFITVLLVIVVAMVMPKLKKQSDRVTEIEQELGQMQKQQTMFKGFVPENWSEQLTELKQELANTQDILTPTLDEVKEISGELVGGKAGAIEQRVENLQSYVNEITKSTSISDLYARLDTMRADITGQKNIDQSMSDLYGLFAGANSQEVQDKDSVNSMLDRARSQSEALGQTFADVPASDLKAAAMLLTLTQMRSTLSREGVPFAQDLDLLMKMTSEDDVELRAALTRLAPYAEQGVLTPAGLSNQFRGLAGDVIVSSLKGEDVSMMEKAQARMNDFLSIEKEGELVSGTPTQAVVNKAQKQLDNGQIAQAVDLLTEKLSAKEIAPLKPWLKQAEALLSAQNAESAIKQAIELNLGRGYLGGSQLLKDDGTGVSR